MTFRTIKRKAYAEYLLLKNPSLTYNQCAKRTELSANTVRIIYENLLGKGLIADRAIKKHTKARKVRTQVTENAKELILENFLKYPTAKVPEIARISGYSFGAVYNVHDRLVAEGKIEPRRTKNVRVCNQYRVTSVDGKMYTVTGQKGLRALSKSLGLAETTLTSIQYNRIKTAFYKVERI